MEVLLAELPEALQHYTGKPIPKWMRMVHPDAAKSILAIEKESGGLVYNDVWRSAELSLWAMQQKSGVQPPGLSAHNYGLAIDFAVESTMLRRGWTYRELLDFLEARGWKCHRRDGHRGSEEWHFNFLGADSVEYMKHASPLRAVTWAAPVEAKMQALYGSSMVLDNQGVQTALQKLRMYSGSIDGIMGPITQQAIAAFQRAWLLRPTSYNEPRFQRTLAFVTATKKIVPVPA